MAERSEAEGAAAGAWLKRFKLDEFVWLNWSWLQAAPDRAEALRRFHEEGITRLAPIAFDAIFEPDFYREAHPEYAGLSDEAAYRRWLFADLEDGRAGSARERLHRLGLELDRFPDGFDWRPYAESQGLTGDRWSALEHLLTAGAPGGDFPAAGEHRAAFATAIGLAFRGRAERSAVAAFEHARWAGDRGYFVTHQLADARFRRGEWRPALQLFEEAVARPEAGEVWTYVNGARAAVRLGAYQAAFDLLEAGKSKVGGDPVWRRAVHDAVEAYFGARSRRARRLYEWPEGRARADRLIEALADRAAAWWTRLDPIGAPLPSDPGSGGRIVLLANFDIPACAHYRVEQKVEQLRALGRPCEVFGPEAWEGFIAALPGAAAAVIFRLPAWPTVVRALGAARTMGVPTFYDVDDLIFDAAEFPDPIEAYGGLLSEADYQAILFGTPLFRKALSLCDAGIAPTSALARAMAPLVRTGRVSVVPNGLDSRNDPFLALPAGEGAGEGGGEAEAETVRIIYASGTKAHNDDWDTLAGPAVLAVMETHPTVQLSVVGHLSLSPEFARVADRVTRIPHIDDMTRFWSVLAQADINLAVLKPGWATDAKSEIKWLEAAVLGIPSVVSATATYREAVRDGTDALLADTPEAWRAALERLVTEPDLRRAMGEAARNSATARYALPVTAARLDNALEAERPTRPASLRKPCIVLVNQGFPPQAVGGAARVVQGNLDAWLDAGLSSEFDFVVVAADEGAEPAYRVRTETYRGVPVLRVAAGRRPGGDWAFEDPEMRRIFADLLEAVRPDLVHLHALQRLTAAPAEACRAAGVPYLITPHDGWWISDWPFLTDETGRVREACGPALIDPPAGVGPEQSRDRVRTLRPLLAGAEAVLGVSRSFAELHRACGVGKLLEVPNGAPALPQPRRLPSYSGRIRLAHLGGVSRHKGLHLVEAALRQGRFDRLELTVADHGRAPGSEAHSVWGATPVRTVGRIPPEHMADVYARHDVVLAPSIWPESYGLVAREAAQAGCWVVAGDRGAIGSDVTPGVNGWVVDVSDPGGLLGVLEAIQADPGRFARPPETRPTLRTVGDQADDLMSLYRKVLAGRPLFAPEAAPWRGRLAGLMGARPGPRRS